MPFQRPTLSDLRLRARALFASKLKGADGTLPKSNITVSSDVIAALGNRRDDLNIVVTGRNAKPELIAIADLVTEMTLIKHHFAAGVKAQPGIEF